MVNNFILKILKHIEKNYNNKYYNFLLLYYYVLEIIVQKYFEKFILKNIFEQENIMEFLNRNEFGINNNQLYKKDIIDENEYYGEFNDFELTKIIKKDFENTFLEEIQKSNIIFDIENYINIFVIIEKNNIKNLRIYSVYIRFYRTYLVQELKEKLFSKLKKYFIIMLIISIIILFIFKFNLLKNII